MSKWLRHFSPAWLGCLVLPLPAIVLWRSHYGRTISLCLFFIACAHLVASAFRETSEQAITGDEQPPQQVWRSRMRTLSLALMAAFAGVSLLLLGLSDVRDFVAVALAFLLLIPSLCVVPYFTLQTGKPLAAIVFTLFAVFGMKLLGCVVVVLVYGWQASAHDPPYTDLSWTHPNLLVWLFWLFTSTLSLSLYFLGQRRFCKIHGRAAKSPRD